MNKNVDDLRNVLFNVIEGVRNGDVSLEKARTVADLSQVIVNSAKMEVEFIKATNGKGKASGFLGREDGDVPALPEPKPDLPPGIIGITTHRIADKPEPAQTGT
jgi:hypothetical protein